MEVKGDLAGNFVTGAEGQRAQPEWELDNGVRSTPSTEKAMATHSSTLAWKIPWTEEPPGLQSMGLLRVRHD